MSPVIARRARWSMRLPTVLVATAALGGCASFSADGGFGSVEQTTRQQLGKEVRWARTPADQDAIDRRVAELLAQPLTADDAVQLALLNNKGLQADFSSWVLPKPTSFRPAACPTRASVSRACGVAMRPSWSAAFI